MQRAEARVPRRLNPPTLPESTHHSFLIRGISREHENSERKEGVNGRQKPVEFLLSSDSVLVNHDIYIYIFSVQPSRDPRIPINCGRRVRALHLSTSDHRLRNQNHPFFFFFFRLFGRIEYLFRFYPGDRVVDRVLRGYYRGTRDCDELPKYDLVRVAEVLESSVITVDGTSISHRFWGISRG